MVGVLSPSRSSPRPARRGRDASATPDHPTKPPNMPDDSRHAEPADATGEGLDFEFTNADFARVCRLIHEQAGISLGPSKRHMVYSRLGRWLRQRRLKRFSDYLDLVEKGGAEERTAFVNSLTTNLTSFFREAHHFPTLATLLREHAAQALGFLQQVALVVVQVTVKRFDATARHQPKFVAYRTQQRTIVADQHHRAFELVERHGQGFARGEVEVIGRFVKKQ